MIKPRLLLLLLIIPALDCSGKVTRLSAADRLRVEHPATIAMLRSMKELPPSVVKACASVSSEHSFLLADPSQRFQVTDALGPGEERLPRRRLIWAAKIPGYYVVHYESGGIAHSYHLLLVASDRTDNAARVVWAAAAVPLRDYEEFLRTLKTDKLDDTLEYHH